MEHNDSPLADIDGMNPDKHSEELRATMSEMGEAIREAAKNGNERLANAYREGNRELGELLLNAR